jgi:hypothetical protein
MNEVVSSLSEKGDKAMKKKTVLFCVVVGALLAFMLGMTGIAYGHCDTMNGPVVKAAQKALETGNVNFVLIWVQKKDEADIRKAFEKTLVVRKLSADAKVLADMYFFETLVRIHRAGEGAPYTGLKPAETEVEPGVLAADQAIEKGSVEELTKHLGGTIEKGVRENFAKVMATKSYGKNDLEAGREYVESYVAFIHYVERLFQSAESSAKGHYEEAEQKEIQKDLH